MTFTPSLHLLRTFLTAALVLVAARAVELDLPPPGAFTIVVIPDTQGYRGARTKATPDSTDPLTNPVFANHIKWIRESVKDQNIVFVSHVGDIVDIDNDEQFQLAQQNLDGLLGVVPFGLAVGNHDMKVSGDASLFQKYFPAERFKKHPWYGGSFESTKPGEELFGNDVNSYQRFSARGLNFLKFTTSHLAFHGRTPACWQ
ncbi:MAG: metallophosphoesterase [Opitutaceae bacterium]|nr:metallophosphoesterase [Opitutaceae bacterium]